MKYLAENLETWDVHLILQLKVTSVRSLASGIEQLCKVSRNQMTKYNIRVTYLIYVCVFAHVCVSSWSLMVVFF